MQRSIQIAFVVLVLSIPASALALGGDEPNGPMNNDKWPTGLAAIVNADNRVYGYFVNWEDTLFFRGNTAAFNVFLAKYAQLPNTKLELVIHPGKLEVQSPWDKQPRALSANWRLYCTPFAQEQVMNGGVKPGPFITRVDLWLGDSVKLAELQVPSNVPVTSGGEIEAFVKQHQSTTTSPLPR